VTRATRPRQRLSEVDDIVSVYHPRVRTCVSLVIASLLALACAERPENSGPAPRSNGPAPASSPAAPERELEPARDAERLPTSPEGALNEVEAEAEPTDPGAEGEVDPLAPILPSGPEPGSPEADAELAELLEESTLTQEEFDAAFRGNKPKIVDDQLVFGAGDRTRKKPVVSVGTPKVEGSTIAASEIASLAKSHMRGYEGCLAAALIEDPGLEGTLNLRVHFDAKGEVSSAKVEGGAALGEDLRECLATVAENWSLAGAAGATVGVSLTLASE
jgi:hypothetical protein